jgi:hypothetical protein
MRKIKPKRYHKPRYRKPPKPISGKRCKCACCRKPEMVVLMGWADGIPVVAGDAVALSEYVRPAWLDEEGDWTLVTNGLCSPVVLRGWADPLGPESPLFTGTRYASG